MKSAEMALHKKSLHIDFSVQPLCSLCLCGVFLLGIHQPPRHREHRGCTEKRAYMTFCAKPTFVLLCLKRLYFETDIRCGRGVRERLNANQLRTGLGILAHVLRRDRSRTL